MHKYYANILPLISNNTMNFLLLKSYLGQNNSIPNISPGAIFHPFPNGMKNSLKSFSGSVL